MRKSKENHEGVLNENPRGRIGAEWPKRSPAISMKEKEKPLSDDEITNLRKFLEAYLTIEQKGWLNTIIEEARKQAVINEDILKRMAKESEELLNNTKELEKIAERRMKEIDDLKKQLKESEQKTAGFLEEIEKMFLGLSKNNIDNPFLKKLKEKYGVELNNLFESNHDKIPTGDIMTNKEIVKKVFENRNETVKNSVFEICANMSEEELVEGLGIHKQGDCRNCGQKDWCKEGEFIEQKKDLVVLLKDALHMKQEQFEKRFLEEYNKIREHRGNCPSWKAWKDGMSAEICLECFGGGLTKFTEKLKEG